MCGVAGIYIRDPRVVEDHEKMERMADALLLQIEARGKHASGFVAITEDGKARIDKAAVPASEFIMTREPLPPTTRAVLLHTRYTTKGSEKNNANNHPVIYGSCFVTHNGTIYNDDPLFEKHKLERKAEVDSEIIAALLSQSDYSPADLRKRLEELRGPMAIAAVDPIKNPGKVLLARGDSSPLVVYDKGSYVIWASLVNSLKEAWGSVIGTPPDEKKFHQVPSYQMLMLTEEGIEKEWLRRPVWESTVKSKEPRRLSQAWYQGEWHPTDDLLKHLPENERLNNSYVETKDIMAATEALRRKREGKALLFPERFGKDVSFEHKLGPWLHCVMCGVMVHEKDISQSARGKICCDCRDMWTELTRSKVKDRLPTTTTTYKEIRQNDYSELNRLFPPSVCADFNLWSTDEDWIHREVLRDMANKQGFDEEALDFLLFRADDDELDAWGDTALVWKDIALAIYEDLYLEAWTDQKMIADANKWIKARDKERLELLPHKSPQLQLVSGDTYTKPISLTPPKPKRTHSCVFCKSKAKVFLRHAETKQEVAYCRKHFDHCNTEGCVKEPNFTRHDGIRVCHDHARGTSGYTDTHLEERGFIVGAKK